MQTIGYKILFDIKFLLRSFSLAGAVLLILAENRGPANHTVFDLPTLTGDTPKVSFCLILIFLWSKNLELPSIIGPITAGADVCQFGTHFKGATWGK